MDEVTTGGTGVFIGTKLFEVFTCTTFGVFTCTTIEVSAADDANGCLAGDDAIE